MSVTILGTETAAINISNDIFWRARENSNFATEISVHSFFSLSFKIAPS
jgi:hypothetical protein